MTLVLRDYQREAIDAVFDYWANEPGNPLIDLGTGLGKSLVMAALIERLLGGWPHMRVVVAAHVEELISQNYDELLGIWPFAPAGIYAASLGRRDHHAQIMFASIHTVYNKTHQIGHVDVLMVDECHLIPFNDDTKYRKFIAGLREINPDMKIVGLTATDYRLDGGRLTEHEDRIFDEVVYSYGIGAGIADGYLAPLTSKAMDTAFDLTGVGKLGGDYKQNALQAAVDKADVTESAVAEIVARGQDRRSWLIFGSGIEHATHIRDAVRGAGIVCEVITGETPKQERRDLIEAFKNYEIRALTNNSVLTTGFNHKGVDLLALMRPTQSLSLYVQMCLDERTEILTDSGWKGPDQIAENDNVAGFDLKTEEIKWQPVLNVVDRALAGGEEMYSIKSPHMDVRVTGGHDMVVSCRSSRVKRNDIPAWRIERAETAALRRQNIYIPVAGSINIPDADITDAEISFLGWFLSDGGLNRKNNAVTISQQVTSPQLPHIVETLDKCGFRYGVFDFKRNNQYADNRRFSISFGDARIPNGTGVKGWSRLSAWINSNKVITPIYDTLSRRQLLILLEALNMGDGKKYAKATWNSQTYSITFGLHRHTADRIQALCVTRGIRANMSTNDPSNCILNICASKNRSVVGGKGEAASGRSSLALVAANDNERVWCVETPMGTIVTRRNGKVAIVGNCGRGTRTLYARGMPLNTPDERKAAIAASEKPNCLVLDFAKLAYTHGPIDMVKPKEPGKGTGEAPVKQCPECDELIHISVMKCTCCGYDFPVTEKDKITAAAGSAPIMSTEVDMWRAVTGRDFKEHAGRDNGDGTRKPDSVKATYMCGMLAVNSWICPGHTGFAKTKADHYWLDHGGQRPFPANAEEFLLRQFELRDTAEIEIEYNGKYPNVRNYRVGEHWSGEAAPAAPNVEWAAELDDEIPF